MSAAHLTIRPPTARSRLFRPIALLLTLLLALSTPGLLAAPSAQAADDTNVALTASPVAVYTPSWNSVGALNDGNNNPTGHAQMWGSYESNRPAQRWVSYSWDAPVSIARSVMYFWRDAATAGTGDNVWVPQSWKLQYKSATAIEWTDVPGASAYTTEAPAAVAGVARSTQIPNEVTFPRIQVTELRALLNAYPGNTSGYSAVAIPEWEVWGVSAAGPPPSSSDPIAVDEIHIPTTVGTQPELPATAWLTFVDGIRAEREVAWAAITAQQLGTVGSFVVTGTADDVSQPISATIHVRAAGANPELTGFLPQSALTVVGTAPQLPPTALATYADKSVDSRVAVTWDEVNAADYAEAGVFSVLGTVAGTAHRPEILVIVDEPGAGAAPVVSLEVDPETPATGWHTDEVTVTASASSDSDPEPNIEYRLGDGTWQDYAAPVVLSDDGEHVVTARATDSDGRISAERSATVKIDATAPVTSKTLTEDDDAVELALAATDELSGVATIQYQVGDGFTATYAGEPVGITRLAEDQTVRFFATDVAGNVEDDQTFTVAALEEEPEPEWPVAPTRSFHSDGNPILGDGSYYSADAAPLVADGKLLIYAGHDISGPNSGSFNMNDYGIFVTDDVDSGDWDLYQNNLDPDQVFAWATGAQAFAGQAQRGPDGRYYWYVPVQWRDTTPANRMAIGVAVADSPVGPWTDWNNGPLVTWTDVFGSSTNGQEVIDPHVFIDDDGKVYLYWGSWNVARVQELGADMKTKIGGISTLSGLTSFFEAPWVIKRNGIYHMVYDWKQGGSACTPSNYQACIGWATATNPKGPWTYRGIILDAQSATTMHPSIIEYGGKWYITYHTKDATGGGHFRRSIAIDEFTWTGDAINKVTPTWADDPKFRLRANVAPEAVPAASFTEQPPMRLGALNDGRQTTALLPPDQWGNYRGTTSTVESDWISYSWATPVRIGSAGIQFHQDSNWIRPPASWQMEYLDGTGQWQPVPNPSGYPTAVNSWQTVTFDPITTTSLRATFKGRPNGSYFHSVSVSEWEVNAIAPTAVSPVSVVTDPGVAPVLPAAVRLTWPGDSSGWAPVNWRPIEPAQYEQEGTFTVQGRALGKADAYVTATVVVDEDGITPPTDDTTPPTVAVSFSGTQGGDGWFRSPVTARVSADDETSYLNTIGTRVGGGAWTSTAAVRFVNVPVTAQGTTTVSGRATDAAGNASAEVSATVKIDTTLPVASHTLNAETRATTVTSSDAHSGIASVTYRFDDTGTWTAYTGTAIPAPDDLPHTLAYRVTDVAGNVTTGTVSIPIAPGGVLTGNIAPLADPTTSFVTGWNSAAGLNDGTAGPLEVFDPGQVDAKLGALQAGAWGTWPQVGEQWARLGWDFPVSVDTVGVWWLADSADDANEGVIPPASWKLQYLASDGTTWVDISATSGGYSRDRAEWNTVGFAPVTTTSLRVLAHAWGAADGEGSIGIHEFQVIAASADVDPTSVAGRITDDASGAAVPGACAYLYPRGQSSAAVAASCAGSGGNYLIPDVPGGSYDLAVFDPTGAHPTQFYAGPDATVTDQADAVAVVVSGTPVTGVDLALTGPATGVVSGTVSGSAGPLPNVCVYLYPTGEQGPASYATCTQADGSFWLGTVGAGSYDIAYHDPTGAHPTGWYAGADVAPAGTRSGAQPVPMAGGATVSASVTLSASTVGVVSGTISGAGGPLAGVCAYLYPHGSSTAAAYATCTGADGRFWFGEVTAAAYDLAVNDPTGGHPTQWFAGAGQPPAGAQSGAVALVVPGGGAVQADLTLAGPQAATVSGLVTSAQDGAPLGSVCVFAYPEGQSAAAAYAGCTVADGSYALPEVASGSYDVAFYDPAGIYATQWFTGDLGGSDTQSAAVAVPVATTAVTGVDAALAVAE